MLADLAPARGGHVVVVGTLLAWGCVELLLRVRLMLRPGTAARLRDWRWQTRQRLSEPTFPLIVGTILVAVIVAAVASRVRRADMNAGGWPVLAGELIAIAGIALRTWAIMTLDGLFTFVVTIAPEHEVVRRGPYRYVRHPGYAGALLALAGTGIALGNWISALVLIVLPTAALLVRIWVEEAALTGALGQDYYEYAGRTARLIPGIW